MKLLHSVNEFFLARAGIFSFSASLSTQKTRTKFSRFAIRVVREAFVYAASRAVRKFLPSRRRA